VGNEIPGVYVREYSFRVTNPETGREVGMRTIRDTIFIRAVENSYEVSNSKWRLNDYDREGWQTMEHAEDRPMLLYRSTFSPGDSSLISESRPSLYLNLRKMELYKSDKCSNAYRKLQI